MTEVRSDGSGGLVLRFEELEADLLRRLLDDLDELYGGDPAQDPVAARLFPEASEDPEAARAFRELAADGLERDKREALEAVLDELGRRGEATARLGPEDADRWLRVLNDVRLALGTHLDVDEQRMSAEPDPADPQAAALGILHWLGSIQEWMLRAMTGSASDDADGV